jgi:tRNA (guanine10-N2)-dimethyltransferase
VYCLELAGEDDAFAAREAESAAIGLEFVAPGLAVAGSVDHARVRTLAYTHAADRLVARTDASIESAELALDAANLDVEGTVAVRARDVRGLTGVSTGEAERTLGGVLVDRGYEVDLDDPDNELRVLFSAGDVGPETGVGAGGGDPVVHGAEGVCVLAWLETESVRGYGAREPGKRPFFQPGSMAPHDARAISNIAGAGPGRTILDPMCGTGGVLIEAGLVGSRVIGNDAQWKMVRGATENLDYYLGGDGTPEGAFGEADRPDDWPPACPAFHVVRGDATNLALRDDSVNGVVFDAPYGRQTVSASHEISDLVTGALSDAYRVSDANATCVLMSDRSWRDAAVSVGWRVTDIFERRVHRSLTRYVHVLEKSP